MKERRYYVNPFRPRKGGMVGEVAVIAAVLVGWAGATFGFQFLLALLVDPATGETPLGGLILFGLPFHFWFTGQFLPLWFIILCALFNVYTDRLAERHSRRRDHRYD